MKIIITGATGMVGQSVLTECLRSPLVKELLIIGRRSCEIGSPKIKEIIHNNFLDFSEIKNELKGYDACFYCLGVSSLEMSKEQYFEITYSYTVAVAKILSKQNSNMHFSFISGAGTDSKEKSRTNWARVKGKAENVLQKYPFSSISLFRPAYIKALDNVTPSYSINKYFDWLLYPVLKTFFPKAVITSRELGLAMINSIHQKEKVKIIGNSDIQKLATLKI